MLQIVSGKFYKFKKKNIITTDAKGIAFSNFSWVSPIETCIMKLEPAKNYTSISSWVLSYQNKIEIDENSSTQIIQMGNSKIIKQFLDLCIVGFNAFFNVDRNVVEINCREKPKSSDDQYLPFKFIHRVFNPKRNGTKDEVDNFIEFVDKVIGLPRKQYKAIMTSIKNITDSLQVLNYNFDLAYSMLIYSLESLSQNFDDYNPSWEYYYPEIRGKLDNQLDNIAKEEATNIRNILLKQGHFRLQRRFIEFILKNISNNFYTNEANEVENALRKSDFEQCLKNSYKMRSGYVHQLHSVIHQLKIPDIAKSEVFNWDNQPYFTYRGLYRLTRHVILNFISKQDYLKTEKYNWNSELPGIVWLKLAPQYWISKCDNFNPDTVLQRFSGFLDLFQKNLLDNKPMIDLSDLLKTYETLIPNVNDKQKSTMISMYALYNHSLKKEYQVPHFEEFLTKYDSIVNVCTIEMMIAHLLLSGNFPYNMEECISEYEKYKKSKYKINSLNIPDLIELYLISEIANMFLRKKDFVEFDKWIDYLCLEAAGKPDIQNLVKKAKSNRSELNFYTFFPKKEMKSKS